MIRTYSELVTFKTIEERYNYLKLKSAVGRPTFGAERYLNQEFYRSKAWRRLRNEIIVRDNGCDLGVDGYDIFDNVYVHHMNPMRTEDIVHGNRDNLDPEFLICVAFRTHNAIHYGDDSQLPKRFVDRRPGDTTLWRR
jgi:hypothetical protein